VTFRAFFVHRIMIALVRSIPLGCSLTVFVASAACGSDRTPTGPSRSTDSHVAGLSHVLVLGDSLAVTPSMDESFPAELQRRVDARGLPWKIVNAGVSGDVTAGGLRRLDSAMTPDTRILVLALGANDGLRGLATATIEHNLATIIERAQARGVRVLLCGMETPPGHGWDYTLDFHRLFPQLAQRYGIPLVPFLLTGVALNPELNGRDGIHPNAAGARQIANTVWRYLEPLIAQDIGPQRSKARVTAGLVLAGRRLPLL
jgi:acyl-CoA thioesterase I